MSVIDERYEQLGGATGFLGAPVNDEQLFSTNRRGAGKHIFDYVTRRFNESSAALKASVRLGLRWDTAWRDHQMQLEPRVSRSEAAVQGAS